MSPPFTGIVADIDARQTLDSAVVERRGINYLCVDRIYFNVPGDNWKVTVQAEPSPTSINRFEQSAPLAPCVEDLIIASDSRKTVNAASSRAVRIKPDEGLRYSD